MSAALFTAIAISLAGLVATAVLGLGAHASPEISRHVLFGIFSTLVTLLAHSMFLFYLIGKGRSVKDAMAEGGLTGPYAAEIAAARKPVFSIGTLAMVLTMITAIVGASVDTGVLPPFVHGLIAYSAIAANLGAIRAEIAATSAASKVVDEVNRLLRAAT